MIKYKQLVLIFTLTEDNLGAELINAPVTVIADGIEQSASLEFDIESGDDTYGVVSDSEELTHLIVRDLDEHGDEKASVARRYLGKVIEATEMVKDANADQGISI